jgi:hypothetical protein
LFITRFPLAGEIPSAEINHPRYRLAGGLPRCTRVGAPRYARLRSNQRRSTRSCEEELGRLLLVAASVPLHGRDFRPVCDRRLAQEPMEAALACALLVSGSSHLQLIFQLAMGDEKFHALGSGPCCFDSLSFDAGRTSVCREKDAVATLRTT